MRRGVERLTPDLLALLCGFSSLSYSEEPGIFWGKFKVSLRVKMGEKNTPYQSVKHLIQGKKSIKKDHPSKSERWSLLVFVNIQLSFADVQ